jgi:hypothetical protein
LSGDNREWGKEGDEYEREDKGECGDGGNEGERGDEGEFGEGGNEDERGDEGEFGEGDNVGERGDEGQSIESEDDERSGDERGEERECLVGAGGEREWRRDVGEEEGECVEEDCEFCINKICYDITVNP